MSATGKPKFKIRGRIIDRDLISEQIISNRRS